MAVRKVYLLLKLTSNKHFAHFLGDQNDDLRDGNKNPIETSDNHNDDGLINGNGHVDGEELQDGDLDGEKASVHQENGEDGTEEVDVSVEEEYSPEDIQRMKDNGEIAQDAHEDSIPKTRKVKKTIRREKEASPRKEAVEERDECVNYVREIVAQLDKFEPVMWTQEYDLATKDFLYKPNESKLYFWVETSGLRYSAIEPPQLNASIFKIIFSYSNMLIARLIRCRLRVLPQNCL